MSRCNRPGTLFQITFPNDNAIYCLSPSEMETLIENFYFPYKNVSQNDIVNLNLENVIGNVNEKITDNKTILMIAAERGMENLVETLLDFEANVNEEDYMGANAFVYSLRNPNAYNLNTINLLLNAGTEIKNDPISVSTPLLTAVSRNDEELVELLLNNGVNVNEMKILTPLMVAAKNNNENIVRMLLRANANPIIQNRSKETALDFATDPDVISLLRLEARRRSGRLTKPARR